MEQKLSECLEGLDKSGSFEDISTLEDKQSEDYYYDDNEDDDNQCDFIDQEEEEKEEGDSEIINA